MPMDTLKILKKHCRALQYLTDNEMEQLVQASSLQQVSKGNCFVNSGDPIEQVYIILDGQVNSLLTTEDNEKKILEHEKTGYILGEAELQNEAYYQCDLIAEENSTLLCMPYSYYMHILALKEQVIDDLSAYAHPKTYRLLVTKYLSNLFSASKLDVSTAADKSNVEQEWYEFEAKVLDELLDTVEWINLSRGEYLFRMNDKATGAYIVVSGVMAVTLPQEDGEIEIDRVTHGGIIGEIALVADESRSANLVAIRNCELFKISADHFRNIADQYPRLMFNIYRTISERFIHGRNQTAYRPKKPNIALFTASETTATTEFIVALHEHFDLLGSTQLLTSEEVDAKLATPGVANIAQSETINIGLMHWLNSLEDRSDYVIYRADEDWSNWTLRCIAQADELVIIADTAKNGDFETFRKNVLPTGQKWSLVLLHPENLDRPRHTAEWMNNSEAARVFHVRKNHKADIARLGRILSGKAFSLVLGGGGARGFAHIGVLRALKELDIPIDMIGGTSIGAPIAGLVAQGYQPDDVKALTKKQFQRLIDWTFPLTSMIRGKRIASTIQRHTGDWEIEDYWIPFFCISTNLTQAHQVVHQRGNSASAIRASVSIPGILPPVPFEGNLLVDGGVLNNLPISVMRALNPSGTVMAIDVVPPTGPRAKQDYGAELSGWRILLSSLNPFQKKISSPSIGAVIMQSFILGSSIARKNDLKQGLADYYQNIHVKNVGLLEFNKVDFAEILGYQSCLQPIKEWWQTEKKV